MDSVKTMTKEKMDLLRSKLDQIPALQEVEVSEHAARRVNCT